MRRIAVPERPDWRDQARAVGFGFHTMYGAPYWVDDAAYAFSLAEIEDRIEDPSEQLHALCLDLVAEVVADNRALRRLAIPETAWDVVRASWEAGDRHLYGRFDLAYDGTGPAKLLEYNADTPTSIFEAAFFQHNWLIGQQAAGVLPPGTDQFNLLQECLVEAFAHFPRDRLFHFACWTDNPEDRGTVAYLMDCAAQAGHQVHLLDIRAIGTDQAGHFTDEADRVITRCFKLYPWEDLLREPFARALAPGIWVEPPWKALLSNKGILPLLWERHAGHPNLLPAFFADDPQAAALDHAVVKPVFGREGGNVAIRRNGTVTDRTGGDYADGPQIVQAYAPLFAGEGGHAVLGSWVVGDRAAGLGVREDAGRITRDSTRFVPHIITAD
ncbi:glutathionylspermidine synthase family protein [Croceibacterium ferulae]|uniref:glutathionylspermidine synthase family protein n=1 Tax=Croceibacterium ferulae TaxID=1854641 RepID=UPI000EB2080A|nr:glutathionylspermidine synthase family protein [Croceibacterium ferulae]